MGLSSGKRLLLLALVISLCATATIAIALLLFGDFGDTELKVLATTALISLYSLLALPAGILADQRRLLPLAWTTAALSVVGFGLAQVLVWGEPGGDAGETLGKLTVTLGAYLVAATQTSASASRLRPGDPGAVLGLFAAAILLVLVLATMVTAAIWTEVTGETYWRLLAALAVANVLLVVLQPVLRRMAAAEERSSYRLRLTLAGGEERELELRERAFADAAALAVREAERDGATVERIERLGLR